MAPTPQRIAQTSTELKKQYKKNGPSVTERQQKQLERGHALDLRASRAREAEQRRKAALQKRKEREDKEKNVRKQLGVGLATQMIGYSHTQAQLKNGMEAFLGVKQRKDEEKRKRELELNKKLDQIAQAVEKEPWDDDDAEDIAAELPELPTGPTELIDDDLDDEALIEAHDVVTSDPAEPPPVETERPASPAPPITTSLKSDLPKDDVEFIRLHGPLNRAIEKVLEQLPEPLIELLSQDISMRLSDWDPAPGLLHKLNPLGLPPHRLRVKVGSVVILLRDLNTSSQLSKSQHLRILRAGSDRLECLVLDGQLEGTKAFLTRVPFHAKYRNEDQFPFQRTQFPIRIAVDFKAIRPSRETSQPGFKMPAIPGRSTPSMANNKPKARPPPPTADALCKANPSFKLPGLPASKRIDTIVKDLSVKAVFDLDGWDDFLESGTQIARELSPDVIRKAVAKMPVSKPPVAAVRASVPVIALPPFSTQDWDFSIDEVDECSTSSLPSMPIKKVSAVSNGLLAQRKEPERPQSAPPKAALSSKAASAAALSRRVPDKAVPRTAKPAPRRQDSDNSTSLIDLTSLRASQRPPSVSDRPGLKRKNRVSPPEKHMPPAKRRSLPTADVPKANKPTSTNTAMDMFDEFMMSTQDAASFFADDDELSFGSPPITV